LRAVVGRYDGLEDRLVGVLWRKEKTSDGASKASMTNRVILFIIFDSFELSR
jgi:hypothetical protein